MVVWSWEGVEREREMGRCRERERWREMEEYQGARLISAVLQL